MMTDMNTITPETISDLDRVTIDTIEQEMLALESLIGRARARQVTLLREIDRRQVPTGDGCASVKEWVTGRLDLHPVTGGELAFLAKSGSNMSDLAAGGISFDRAAAIARLKAAGADEVTIERSRGVAVQQVRRIESQHTLHKLRDETQVFEDRHLYAQFSLDFTWVQIRGGLAGVDGERLLAGLDQRADTLVSEDDEHRPALPQRRADALVSWALDELDGDVGSSDGGTGDGGTGNGRSHRMHGAIFIDAQLAARSRGEAGASTRHGLRVGPNTLAEILCSGTIDITLVDDGILKAVGTGSSSLPPRTRRYVLQRDGGCTADGCTSRYRLEPHHILPRSMGGSDDPINLTTLCWFHHHVVVHQRGYEIDPQSPPGRRRFRRSTRAPPDA